MVTADGQHLNQETMMKTQSIELKHASLGSISTGTLRTEDLLDTYARELEWQIQRNGEFYSRPENHNERDRLNNLVHEALELDPESEDAGMMINETLADALSQFAPPYGYFGCHPGDGADIGFWLSDIEEIKEQVEFSSTQASEYPDDDFEGEWLYINERGNCTLYVRQAGKDKEVWSIV